MSPDKSETILMMQRLLVAEMVELGFASRAAKEIAVNPSVYAHIEKIYTWCNVDNGNDGRQAMIVNIKKIAKFAHKIKDDMDGFIVADDERSLLVANVANFITSTRINTIA